MRSHATVAVARWCTAADPLVVCIPKLANSKQEREYSAMPNHGYSSLRTRIDELAQCIDSGEKVPLSLMRPPQLAELISTLPARHAWKIVEQLGFCSPLITPGTQALT